MKRTPSYFPEIDWPGKQERRGKDQRLTREKAPRMLYMIDWSPKRAEQNCLVSDASRLRLIYIENRN